MPHINPADTLLVFALPEESQTHFSDFPLLHCGVGKINASYRLMRALAGWRQKYARDPALIMNLGSAGGVGGIKAGAIVNCTGFVQRDFDTTSLGTPAFATPFEDVPALLENGLAFAGLPQAICGSGDNFATDSAAQAWQVVDMEAYALAKVCLLENIPFGCLKFITDAADESAAQSWQDQLAHTAVRLRATIEPFLIPQALSSDLPVYSRPQKDYI